MLLVAAGCTGHKGPGLHIVVAHDAGKDAAAPACATGQDLPISSAGLSPAPTLLRFTVRSHASAGDKGAFVCDRVLNVGEAPSIRAPVSGAVSLDIWAEAFAPPDAGQTQMRRVASGVLTGLQPNIKQPDLTMRLYPDERFRCANQRMARARAFHSATLLPDGRVLIVGGLVPSADVNAEAFSGPALITGGVEVFDPKTGAFKAIVESAAPAPRAFHQAALVATSGTQYQVLLVGGATIADDTMAAFGLNPGGQSAGTRLVPFTLSGAILAPLPVAGAKAELLTFDGSNDTVTRAGFDGFTPALFQGTTQLSDGVLVADGVDWKGMPASPAQLPKAAQVSRAQETPRSLTLAAARIGPSFTALSDDSALLWGGLIGYSSTSTEPIGELIGGAGAGHTLGERAIQLVSMPPPTQFHSATFITGNDTSASVLMTGGFVSTPANGGQALDPPTPTQMPARLITVTTSGTATIKEIAPSAGFDPTCMSATRYRPAGWQSALELGRDRVLITGGAPSVAQNTAAQTCNDCDGGSDYHCATRQASLFTAGNLGPAREGMLYPRYGHTSTLLADGNVLILGGVTAVGDTPRILRDAEIYNPRALSPTFDAATGDPDDPIAPTPRMPGKSIMPCSDL